MVAMQMIETPTPALAPGTKAKPSQSAKLLAHTPPTIPTALCTSAHQLHDEICGIYQELNTLNNLSPGAKLNALLTRLVGLCVKPYGSDLVAYFLGIEGVRELCVQLQSICATAEGELERTWASRIAETSFASDGSATHPRDLLHQFPYYKNYIDLSRLETSLFCAFLPPTLTSTPASPLHIVFIGSGPLPLTSFCLLDALPNATIHNIDRDASALQLSKELAEKVGLGRKMSFVCEDVSDGKGGLGGTRWGDMDVVFLAALVGMDMAAKMEILKRLAGKLRVGSLVVARSALGLRAVLYPVLELSDDLSRIGYEILAELHPHTDVVNSIILLRVKAL